MLSAEEYKAVCALHDQGWSISQIARYLGPDRKTVRAYLRGDRTVGVRAAAHDEFLRFVPYCRQRLDDDPHLQANILHGEVVELGYRGAYSTFTRALRKHLTRPNCALSHRESADPASGRVEDVRFDWVELPDPPAGWDCGRQAHLLMASLTRSGRWRAALTGGRDLAQCVEAVDHVLRRLGGTGGRWLFDRTPPVCSPSGKVTVAFREVATYYGAFLAIRAQRDQPNPMGRAHRSVIRYWWANDLANDMGMQAAQHSLDRMAERSDGRRRRATCEARALLALPPRPFPAKVCAERTVDPQGLVPFDGNFYAVPADLVGAQVEVHLRLGEPRLSVSTARGAVIACFEKAPTGMGATVIGSTDLITLERPRHPLGAGSRVCPAGPVRPPRSRAALAEAEALSRHDAPPPAKPSAHAACQETGRTHRRAAGPGAACPHQVPTDRPTDGCRARGRCVPPQARP
jgi:hypothetical protein